MTIRATARETAIAKMQQLPELLLQEISDFIDATTRNSAAASEAQATLSLANDLAQTWENWFETTAHLELTSAPLTDEYRQSHRTQKIFASHRITLIRSDAVTCWAAGAHHRQQ